MKGKTAEKQFLCQRCQLEKRPKFKDYIVMWQKEILQFQDLLKVTDFSKVIKIVI